MSHAVTVTRTTTTVTTTSAILLNIGYLKTVPGILKLSQLVLGCIVVGLVGNYIGYYRQSAIELFVPELFLLLISTTCLITTACLLFSCLLSISTATIIAKTMFELMYHGIAAGLYVASSAYFLALVANNRSYNRDGLIAAGVFVLHIPESLLYLCSSLNYLGAIISRNVGESVAEYGYSNKIFAGVIAAINALLYLLTTILAFRNYRRV